jgi:putative methyltransferase small domain protein
LQKWLDAHFLERFEGEFTVSRYATSKGFRVLEVLRS